MAPNKLCLVAYSQLGKSDTKSPRISASLHRAGKETVTPQFQEGGPSLSRFGRRSFLQILRNEWRRWIK
jgi:hypothetical protein